MRTVSRLTDIKDYFKLRGMVYQFEEVTFAGQGQLETDNPSDKRTVDIRRPMFKRPGETEFLHFPVFVSRNPETVHSIDDGSGLLLFQYDDWLDLRAGDEQFRVHKVRMPFRLNRFTKESKARWRQSTVKRARLSGLRASSRRTLPKGKLSPECKSSGTLTEPRAPSFRLMKCRMAIFQTDRRFTVGMRTPAANSGATTHSHRQHLVQILRLDTCNKFLS